MMYRPQPFAFCVLKTVLQALLYLCAIAGALAFVSLFVGCGTVLKDPSTGRTIAAFRSDIWEGEYSAGQTHFKFARMSNSIPTRAALLGTNKIISTVASAGVAIAVPGSGVAPAVVRGATVTAPHLLNPTTPAP